MSYLTQIRGLRDPKHLFRVFFEPQSLDFAIRSGFFLRSAKRSDYTGNDVLGGSKDARIIADKRAKRAGENYFSTSESNKGNCTNNTGYFSALSFFGVALRSKWKRYFHFHR